MRRLPLTALLVPSRRSFLQGIGVGVAAVAAGCTGKDVGGDSGGSDGDPGDSVGVGDTGATTGGDTGATTGGDTGTTTGGDTGATTGGDTGAAPSGLCEDADLPALTECRETAERGLGPYYREGAPDRVDLNPLGEAGDEPLVICGRILDRSCRPVAGARIELWHVAPDGFYDNLSDDFRFRGVVTSDADGAFGFSTLMPIHYEEGDGVILPKHVHVRVTADGFADKVTQIYFEGDEFLRGGEPRGLIISTAVDADGVRRGTFDIVLAEA